MTAPATPVAQPVAAKLVRDEIKALGLTHVLTVPDSHQKTLLALLAAEQTPRLLTICTEDEAIAMNLGLYVGGKKSMLVIQNNGLYACINALKALSFEARVPTLMMIGEFLRDPALPSGESPVRAVRMLEPTLEAWDIPYYRLDGPEDLPNVRRAYEASIERRGPVAIPVGARMS